MAKAKSKKAEKKVDLPMMVRVSTLKEFTKSKAEVNVSSEFADAVNERVAEMVEGAIKRCEGNSRKTVRAVDL